LKADLEALSHGNWSAQCVCLRARRAWLLTPRQGCPSAAADEGEGSRASAAYEAVGWIGELHPTLVRELGFSGAPVLFEVDVAGGLRSNCPALVTSRGFRRCDATSLWSSMKPSL